MTTSISAVRSAWTIRIAGAIETGDREQREPRACQPRAPVGRGLLERAHRGVKRRGAPQEVVRDPAHVQQHLVVVGALEQHVVVDRVGYEQADDARREQVERRLTATGVDREADRRGEQQHVAERVGHRDALGEVGHAAQVDVRRDQEHPREEADAERQDQRVDQAGAVEIGLRRGRAARGRPSAPGTRVR